MTKQTLYLNNIEAVCLLNSPLLERSDDLSNKTKDIIVHVSIFRNVMGEEMS